MRHSSLGSSVRGEEGERERTLERRMGVLQVRALPPTSTTLLLLLQVELQQERVVCTDLQQALEGERRQGLEMLGKLSRERRGRQEQEQEKQELARQVAELRSQEDTGQLQETVEAQKLQILSLEESLEVERRSLVQMQEVLEIERSRRKEGGRLEEMPGWRDGCNRGAGDLVARQMEQELWQERGRRQDVEGSLERERRRYRDIKQEYDHLKLKASVQPEQEVSIFRPPAPEGQEQERQLRSRTLELERFCAELEVRGEGQEQEARRLRQEVARLEQELGREQEKGLAGMSQEQLARMRGVNSFLEQNLKENGEMLMQLGKVQEEKQVMRAANWSLRDRLADCVCSSSEERGKSLYGRYLR